MTKRNKIIVSIIGITIVLLALLGLTYAYYLTRIIGNTNETSISITTADLKLIYGDGNGKIEVSSLMPGQDIPEKKFTVTNEGNTTINGYAVSIEEVINTLTRTEDLIYTLTCKQLNPNGVEEGSCNGRSGTFPQVNSMIITNSIKENYTHEYTLKIVYEYLDDINQSDDMGSTINGKVQIYGTSDTIDLTGTVSNIDEGDYVQINSEKKTSQILNGEYKLVGIEPGLHTIRIMNNGVEQTKEYISIGKGNETSVGEKEVTLPDNSKVTVKSLIFTDSSGIATVDINGNIGTLTVNNTISNHNPNEGILAVDYNNNGKVTFTTNTLIEDADIKENAVSIPFSVSNISDTHQNLTIKLKNIQIDDALKTVDFRWGLYNADTDNGISFGVFKYAENGGEELLYTDTIIDAGTEEANNYKLKMWLHNNGSDKFDDTLINHATAFTKSFSADITVTSESIAYTPESCFTLANEIEGYEDTYMGYGPEGNTIVDYDESCGTDVVIPKSIKGVDSIVIGPGINENVEPDYVFDGITRLILPSNLLEIGFANGYEFDSFIATGSLTHLTIPENVEWVGYSAFKEIELKSLFIAENTGAMGGAFNGNIKTLIFHSNHTCGDAVASFFTGSADNIIIMHDVVEVPIFDILNNIHLKSTFIEIPSSVKSFYIDNKGVFNKIVIRGKESLDDFDYVAADNLSDYEEIIEFRP